MRRPRAVPYAGLISIRISLYQNLYQTGLYQR